MLKDERWLIKNLRRYKIEDINAMSINHSLNYMRRDINDRIKENIILPWHLDSLFLMKVAVGDGTIVHDKLTEKLFRKMINLIVDFECSYNNSDPQDVLSKIIVNQKKYQFNQNIFMYRANYIYNYKNEFIDMRSEFRNEIGVEPKQVEILFNALYLLLVNSNVGINVKLSMFKKIFEKKKYLEVIDKYTVDLYKLKKSIENDNIEVFQLSLYNYYLNPYLIVKKNKEMLLTYPHNIISSYCYGSYYRIMGNTPNEQLRSNFGKYVLEDYLYKIVYDSKYFDLVLKEFKYGKQNLVTPDVIAVEGNTLLLFEMKASVVPKNLRDINNVGFIDNILKRESDKINQVYKQIQNYREFEYPIKGYSKPFKTIKGIIVNFEDSHLCRRKIIERFFQDYLSESTDSEREEIFDIIRIIDLSNLELLLLYRNTKNFRKLLFEAEYTTLNYASSLKQPTEATRDLELFVESLDSDFKFLYNSIFDVEID